jgi:hypothetical protein
VIRTRTNPLVFAVALAFAGVCDGRRLYGAEVVFPDIGEPFVSAWFFLVPISREADEVPHRSEASSATAPR